MSADTAYNGSLLPAQTITNQNTDPPGISVTPSSSSLSESGSTISVGFALLSDLNPTNATVTMTVTIDDTSEASFSSSSIVTSTVVSLTQSVSSTSVTVYGVDDNLADGTVSFNLITGDPSSDLDTGTDSYNSLTASDVADVSLQTTDNDKVSDIYSDYGGYWTSGADNISATKPDDTHNLLGFSFGGKTYATGVSNTTLDNQSIIANSNALRFKESDRTYVSLGDPLPLREVEDITIEAWIKVDQLNSNPYTDLVVRDQTYTLALKKYAKDKLSETIKLTQSTGKISAATPTKVTEEETGVAPTRGAGGVQTFATYKEGGETKQDADLNYTESANVNFDSGDNALREFDAPVTFTTTGEIEKRRVNTTLPKEGGFVMYNIPITDFSEKKQRLMKEAGITGPTVDVLRISETQKEVLNENNEIIKPAGKKSTLIPITPSVRNSLKATSSRFNELESGSAGFDPNAY